MRAKHNRGFRRAVENQITQLRKELAEAEVWLNEARKENKRLVSGSKLEHYQEVINDFAKCASERHKLRKELEEARAEVERLRTTIGWIDEIVKKW